MIRRLARTATGYLTGTGRADCMVPRATQPLSTVAILTALIAFGAVLALALAVAATRLADGWKAELADAATLQIFAPEEEIESQARAALDVLRATPGVQSVRMVDLSEQERLLEPWLGPDIPVESLPLPLLIEVEADRAALDQAALLVRLQAEAPGAVFDDHAAWREPLVATAGRLRTGALAALGFGGGDAGGGAGARGAGGGRRQRPRRRDAAPCRSARRTASAAPSPAVSFSGRARGRRRAPRRRWRSSCCCPRRAPRASSPSAFASPAGTGRCRSPCRRSPA